jgi:hypothetical protein
MSRICVRRASAIVAEESFASASPRLHGGKAPFRRMLQGNKSFAAMHNTC